MMKILINTSTILVHLFVSKGKVVDNQMMKNEFHGYSTK